MDGNLAIEHSYATLKRLLAVLLVYVGLADDTGSALRATDTVAHANQALADPWTVSRRVRDLVLQLLRPVEAATRRLIVVLAGDLPIPKAGLAHAKTREPGGQDAPTVAGASDQPSAPAAAASSRPPLFALADRSKRFDWFYRPPPPRALPWPGPGAERASPYEQLDAAPLLRRVAALAAALDDLPRHARLLARWRAARIAARAAGKFVSVSPLRIGLPPGSLAHRAPQRDRRCEHDILAELHRSALNALARLDTS